MVAAALQRGEGHPGNPVGGLIPMAFLSLMDSTQLAGLAPAPQGLAKPTNRENGREWSDSKTNGMTGGGRGRTPPTTETKKIGGQAGSGGYVQIPPHNYGRQAWDPQGGPRDPGGDGGEDGWGRGGQGGKHPPPKKRLEDWGLGPQGAPRDPGTAGWKDRQR